MLDQYREHVKEREQQEIPPLPLNAEQTQQLCDLLISPPKNIKAAELMLLFTQRILPGVDDASKIKSDFLADIINEQKQSPLISKQQAIEILATMQGGYNVQILIDCLSNSELAMHACKALSETILMFDAFYAVEKLAQQGNTAAQQTLKNWADGSWFNNRAKLAEKITLTVFKVPGEINTDDLSPATEAWSRSDIPLHALSMLKMPREGIETPLQTIAKLKQNGYPVVFVGDVVGTGSSRKSAVNSMLWHIGQDIAHVPNKKTGGYCFANQIAPIFFNTLEDAGTLGLEMDVSAFNTGDIIDLYPYQAKICHHNSTEIITHFTLKTPVLFDEIQAAGRINLMIGKALTHKARQSLQLTESSLFTKLTDTNKQISGYTLAQKIVGRACSKDGVRPHEYCEPLVTTVGSQDTTGPMTRDELKDLACLGFSADLVLQSFCHTAAYPKPVDKITHQTLPQFINQRGGISLKPGDGVIHSWLNRMLLPDTVGTGGDSHTRFPMGISFPAGSGLVAFAAATGVMPLDMPESVLVRFKGNLQAGITLRDLVNAIPYAAIQQGLLTIEKKNKKNIFSGRILEIEGLDELSVEQAFEFTDASAERSAAACTLQLSEKSIREYTLSNIALLQWMIKQGYQDISSLQRRIDKMQQWLEKPELLKADKHAQYAEIIEIDLEQIKEPLLACPNDPDDIKTLSKVSGETIDEVFIGSCMTNIGHFRAAGEVLRNQQTSVLATRLWLAPPTKMDESQLKKEGYYDIYHRVGARTEMPGCSLCMGNQARVTANSTVVSTSTRNFPNRLGDGALVYLASAELAAAVSVLGKIPTLDEYQQTVKQISAKPSADIYRYLNFHQMDDYHKP